MSSTQLYEPFPSQALSAHSKPNFSHASPLNVAPQKVEGKYRSKQSAEDIANSVIRAVHESAANSSMDNSNANVNGNERELMMRQMMMAQIQMSMGMGDTNPQMPMGMGGMNRLIQMGGVNPDIVQQIGMGSLNPAMAISPHGQMQGPTDPMAMMASELMLHFGLHRSRIGLAPFSRTIPSARDDDAATSHRDVSIR